MLTYPKMESVRDQDQDEEVRKKRNAQSKADGEVSHLAFDVGLSKDERKGCIKPLRNRQLKAQTVRCGSHPI